MALVNPLTPFVLARTIFFQVGILGCGVLFVYLFLIPKLKPLQGMHSIEPEEKESIQRNAVLRFMFGKANKWYDHIWFSLLMTTLKAGGFIFLVGTLGVLLTDVGWLDSWNTYIPNWTDFFILARASGAPNGAHLLSYIPLPLLGGYIAWRYRKLSPGNPYLGDTFQGILIVAFGVAIHELIWLVVYLIRYYGQLGLFVGSNFVEDFFFAVMCVMFLYGFWRYPNRTIPLRAFKWPIVGYLIFMFVWFLYGVPVSTINNFQIGKGPFEITQWWADPIVNGVEILSWVYIATSFFLIVRHYANQGVYR